jgi:hypothetical protein
MTELANQIISKMLDREPTAEEYRRLNKLLKLLPDAMRSSPGAMADVAMRIAFQSQVEETLRSASWSAQQEIHRNLPARVDAAAVDALNRIRDTIPANAADASSRLLKLTTIWMIAIFLTVGPAGFIVGQAFNQSRQESQRAALMVDRSRCVDAAIGRLAVLDRRSGNRGTEQLDSHRHNLLECLAEP